MISRTALAGVGIGALAMTASLLSPVAASAATIGFAEAIGEMSAACSQDIAKLCPKEPLGGGRVEACLRSNGSRVSSACRAADAQVHDLLQRRKTARTVLASVCERDIRRFCAGVQPGDANLLECFQHARANVSAACRKTVEDAGYDVSLNPGPITDQVHLSSGDLLGSLEAVGSTPVTAAALRQLAAQSAADASRGTRVNRAPVSEALGNLAQLTLAIEFDFNSARLRPNSYRAVGLIADALYHPHLQDYCFLVIGHTDAVGNREYNLKLSQLRAEAVRDALINPFGIAAGRIDAVGMGEEQLLDAEHPDASDNRRVQVVNVGKLGSQCKSAPR